MELSVVIAGKTWHVDSIEPKRLAILLNLQLSAYHVDAVPYRPVVYALSSEC